MGAGQVDVQILSPNITTISGAIAALRVTANDKWMITSLANGQQILLAHVEEA